MKIFKLCIRFNIPDSMIRSFAYNDLLFLIIDLQIDEIETYQKQNKKDEEVIELSPEETTRFLCGNLPNGGEING